MSRRFVMSALLMAATLGGCSRGLSPEEKAQVEALTTELAAVKAESGAAEGHKARYGSSLVGVLAATRLEVLKTNEALLQQRIHAIESGATLTIQIPTTKPDPERATQLEAEIARQTKVAEASQTKAENSGGLVGALNAAGAATDAMTLAALRQQYLTAKYGLAAVIPPASVAQGSTSAAPLSSPALTADAHKPDLAETKLQEEILLVTLRRKKLIKQTYNEFMTLDVTFKAAGLDKPARAIKGSLIATDLFGERRFRIGWTIDMPITPGDSQDEDGSGFEYNKFKDEHQWMVATKAENMRFKFRVSSILYSDGTRRDFD